MRWNDLVPTTSWMSEDFDERSATPLLATRQRIRGVAKELLFDAPLQTDQAIPWPPGVGSDRRLFRSARAEYRARADRPRIPDPGHHAGNPILVLRANLADEDRSVAHAGGFSRQPRRSRATADLAREEGAHLLLGVGVRLRTRRVLPTRRRRAMVASRQLRAQRAYARALGLDLEAARR